MLNKPFVLTLVFILTIIVTGTAFSILSLLEHHLL